MIGLAELRLDAGDAVGALEAAKRGIKFVFDRNKVREGGCCGRGRECCDSFWVAVLSMRMWAGVPACHLVVRVV
jgi:hypothetical protein